MAKESQAIVLKLKDLRNDHQHQTTVLPSIIQQERMTLPPHLSHAIGYIGTTSATGQHHQGSTDPFNLATGLAEPSNPAQVSAAPA